MFSIWPNRGCALMKKDLKYAGPFGLAAMLCGSVFIDRLNHEKALITMQNTSKTINERNVSGNERQPGIYLLTVHCELFCNLSLVLLRTETCLDILFCMSTTFYQYFCFQLLLWNIKTRKI